MQGVVLDALERYVVQELGQTGLSRMRKLVGRDGESYQFGAVYPDEQVGLIVGAIAVATRKTALQVLEEFGEGMVPGLLDVYGFLVDPRWSFREFLLNTETVIHRGVRLSTPKAKPPNIQVEAVGAEALRVIYGSRRRLCAIARGILRGAARHYGVTVDISDERCMLRGDLECYILVQAH